MATRPKVVRQGDLINQLVLDRNTLEELGRVDVLWMYPPAHRVLGFVCKSGFLGSQKSAFTLEQVYAIGENGVLTAGAPEATDAHKVRQLESLITHEVWSDAGNRLGKITDCLFNLRTGTITHYLFVSNGWGGIAGDVYQLPSSRIVSFGRKRVLVAETDATRFPIYQEGIHQKLSEAGDFLRESYRETSQELRSLTQRAQVVTEQARERLQDLTEQARERAQGLSEQAKTKAQILREQLQEKGQQWADQARERSYSTTEQIREQVLILSEQLEDGIQTLTVQAEEVAEPFRPAPEVLEAPEVSKPPEVLDLPEELENPFSDFAAPAVVPSPAANEEDDDDEPWI